MESKLYVGNINWGTTEEAVKELFSNYGEVVSVKIITDNLTGRSKGFGFVEMSSQAEAEQAISELNGKDYEGRPLKVNIARPPQKRTNNFRSNSGDRGGRNKY